ncbi:probable iron binding protein from the HesB_IscA_SufA family [uncultured Candidatus Thioglobus sp.]|nr:probable iron binding protein from the HesB_IscA_SufA family [uncultured Candidatus Thioglobus sp.]SMN00927.1 probable iron binding protein from the HesB_IscA_SufA family [uncultured Candidatus Thioglobus sp.]
MEALQVTETADIIFSDSAAKKVSNLIVEEKNDDLRLRVYITGGGCSGFSYGFTFDDKLKEGDSGVTNKGVELVVDPMSYQYLIGATVDYLEDLQGSRFIIHNPNAKTTCGCGSSFSV